MKRFLFAFCLIAFAIVDVADAQTAEFNAWQVVERCLSQPTMPDEAWSYDGEILLYGWAGIHGVNASQDTPYVVKWGQGGTLSPDGQWILSQQLRTNLEFPSNFGSRALYEFFYGDIIIENLTTDEIRRFPWNGYDAFSSRAYLFGAANPIWLDNQHFAAFYGYSGGEVKIVNIETSEVTDWVGISFEDFEISISPDQTRMISYGQLYDLPQMRLLQEEFVGTDHDIKFSIWAQDSSAFVDTVYDSETGVYDLTIFDRDGNRLAAPFKGEILRVDYGAWSPTNRYFAVMITSIDNSGVNAPRFFILDMQQQIAIDLCVNNMRYGFAWSPDGSKFAAIFGTGQQPIVVAEIDTWQSYIVGYHTGSLVFWRDLDQVE